MNAANRVRIQYKSVCNSHSTKTFRKGMNLNILPPAMGKQ